MARMPSMQPWIAVNLGEASRIPEGKGHLFKVRGLSIAVFRSRDGRLFATQAECPHQGGNLADGLLGRCTIVCPRHSYGYDLASGQPAGHSCRALKTYPVHLNAKQQIIVMLD